MIIWSSGTVAGNRRGWLWDGCGLDVGKLSKEEGEG